MTHKPAVINFSGRSSSAFHSINSTTLDAVPDCGHDIKFRSKCFIMERREHVWNAKLVDSLACFVAAGVCVWSEGKIPQLSRNKSRCLRVG